MTVNDELERAQKEAVVPVLKHYPYLRETKNNHKKNLTMAILLARIPT
jgi:hypothetical protein